MSEHGCNRDPGFCSDCGVRLEHAGKTLSRSDRILDILRREGPLTSIEVRQRLAVDVGGYVGIHQIISRFVRTKRLRKIAPRPGEHWPRYEVVESFDDRPR